MNRFLAIAGLTQLAAAFTPAAHVRLLGDKTFASLPTAGLLFVSLGIVTTLTALWPRKPLPWISPFVSAVLTVIVYAKLRWAPSGGWVDPVFRRVVKPTWGFGPMSIAVLMALAAAWLAHRTQPREMTRPQ
jgi:hypothetical protein